MRVSGSLQHEDGSGFLQRETDLIPYNTSGFFRMACLVFYNIWRDFSTILVSYNMGNVKLSQLLDLLTNNRPCSICFIKFKDEELSLLGFYFWMILFGLRNDFLTPRQTACQQVYEKVQILYFA